MAICRHCGCVVLEGNTYCGGCVAEVAEALDAEERRRAFRGGPYYPYAVLIFPTIAGIFVTFPLWGYLFGGMDAGPTGRENWPLIYTGLVAFHCVASVVIGRLMQMRCLGKVAGSICAVFVGWISFLTFGLVGGPILEIVHWIELITTK